MQLPDLMPTVPSTTAEALELFDACLLYTSPSPRD